MLTFLVGLFEGLVGVISGVLPESPFVNMSLTAEFDLALGYLNWVLPVGNCLNWFVVWVGLMLTVTLVKWTASKAGSIATSLPW